MYEAFDEKRELISIVVPVYNAAAFLEETIACVQGQSHTDWELLLVDDCSEDESGAIAARAASADCRVRPVRQDRNQGAAAARNRGIAEAAGRYLCFLDADDIWQADKLQAELDFMKEKQAGFVFTGYEFADEHGRGLGKVVQVPETICYKQALKNTTIFTSTVMIDRARIPDEDIRMPDIASEDTATWWQILRKHGTGYGLNRNLVKYRRSANTLSSNKVTAVKRIWSLYRRQERLSLAESLCCMVFWAFRAVARRV